MAITFGLWIGTRQAVAQNHAFTSPTHPKRLHLYTLLVALACAWLLWVVIRDVPQLQHMEQQYQAIHGGQLKPRFWLQGMIHD